VRERDGDCLPGTEDNCPGTPNAECGGTCTSGDTCRVGRPCMNNSDCGTGGFCSMNQDVSNSYGIGDACYLCEGNFDCDSDVDGTDTFKFKDDFGRSNTNNPCSNDVPCKGDFNCDHDVDGSDALIMKSDFGRIGLNKPCPACVVGNWCCY